MRALLSRLVELAEKELRREVGAIGLLKRMEVRVQRESLEEFEIAQRLKNCARKLTREVNFALTTIVVTQPEPMFAHESGANELGRCHSSGSIG